MIKNLKTVHRFDALKIIYRLKRHEICHMWQYDIIVCKSGCLFGVSTVPNSVYEIASNSCKSAVELSVFLKIRAVRLSCHFQSFHVHVSVTFPSTVTAVKKTKTWREATTRLLTLFIFQTVNLEIWKIWTFVLYINFYGDWVVFFSKLNAINEIIFIIKHIH